MGRHARRIQPSAGKVESNHVDLCHKVMVLMYHLIFRAVGFEGVYIDHSTHGWRPKCYGDRPPTEEEIAVTGYFMWKRATRNMGMTVITGSMRRGCSKWQY